MNFFPIASDAYQTLDERASDADVNLCAVSYILRYSYVTFSAADITQLTLGFIICTTSFIL
jgi:hypothetical protein